MLDRGWNQLGENKGLSIILSVKDKSIEDVLENYLRVGVLTKILEQQVSKENLKAILRKSLTSESSREKYKRSKKEPNECTVNTAKTVECTENVAVNNRSTDTTYTEQTVPETSALCRESSNCIPEEDVSNNSSLNSSFLNDTSHSRCDVSIPSIHSFTSSTSILTSELEEEACDVYASTSYNAVLDSLEGDVQKDRKLSKLINSSPIAVEDSNSATSVYYDAVQSLSSSDTNLKFVDHKADYLNELARIIVSTVIFNAQNILHLDTKSGSASDLNNNFEHKHDIGDIKEVQSEINFERQGESFEATGENFLSREQRDWLSTSQPNCLPESSLCADSPWGSRQTRSSQSSPANIREGQTSNEIMNLQNEQMPFNGTHNVGGDVAAPLETNLDEDEETSQSKLWSFFSNFGDVKYANVVRDHKTKKSKGFGYVQYRLPEDASKVLSIPQHDLFLDDRELLCSPARSKCEVDKLRYDQRMKFLQAEADSVAPNSSSSSEYQSVGSDIPSPTQDTEDVIAGENYVDNLTDDMLLQIFSFLNLRERIQYERVSKRWQAVLIRSWKSVKKISFENTVRRFGGMSDMKFQKIVKRTRTVKNLDISHVTKMLSDRAAEIIGLYCPNVTELDISGLPVRNKSLKELADKCTKLQCVKLNNCYSVPEKGLWWLLHQCKNLKHIEIENNKKITGQCFHLLSPGVESLCLSECNMVTDGAIQRLGDRSHCLTELHLDHCRELTASAVETIGKKCRMLTKLHLRGHFPKIESQGLVWLGRLHQLEELYISENLAVADSTLHSLSKGCPKLRILDLTSCYRLVTDAGLQDLTNCSNIEELYISYLHQVHDEGLERIAVTCNLKTLVARGCGGITDAVLVTIVQHCPIEFIDISGNTQLTITSIRSFADTLVSREETKLLTMIVGGINIDESELPSHPLLNISQRNTCQRHLRQDLDPCIDFHLEDSDYEDEFDDFNDFEAEDDFDGLIAGDSWVVSENAVQDLLENDDPLAMEEFEMS